jgi:hypothetical protein
MGHIRVPVVERLAVVVSKQHGSGVDRPRGEKDAPLPALGTPVDRESTRR